MSKLKVFGYPSDGVDHETPCEMREVTFQAAPETLRALARFLELAANDIEAGAEHVHLCDQWGACPQDAPSIVAFRPA